MKQFIHSVGYIFVLGILFSGCGAHVYHQVQKDDTLYSISWRYNQDYRQVAQWNNLNSPFVIHEGEWLRVAPPTRHTLSTTYQSPQSQFHPQSSQSPHQSHQPSPPEERNVATSGSTLLNFYKKHLPKKEPIQPSLKSEPINWQWPTSGKVLTRFHANILSKQGIDIGGQLGQPIYAAASGRVVYSGNGLRGYGNLIIIKHNEAYLSAYAHNQRLLVKEGAVVDKGQVIAYMGNTEADKVKLHFQVRLDGKPINPLAYLPQRGS